MNRRSFVSPHIAAAILALAVVTAARADLYVVAHASNPQAALTQKEVLDLFMGRRRAFADGSFAFVFDLPRDSAVRDRFYQQVAGMSPSRVNSYWARLMFSGQAMPPQLLPDERAVVEVVKRNPNALGYLGSPPGDKGVRVLLVVRERAPD
jgi:hypothetical protein